MKETPKSLRLQVAIFGRTNVGKSSFLNFISGQDVAITSAVAGTTTDVVEKNMELLPLGPVTFLDTAGLDDASELAAKRLEKTRRIFDRADIILLLTEPGVWTEYEEGVIGEAKKRKIPSLVVVNKTDLKPPQEDFLAEINKETAGVMACSSLGRDGREEAVKTLKKYLLENAPDSFLNPAPLIGDLLPAGSLAVFIVPIDLQAPKGRLIMPQVQAIRDALDNDAAVTVVKEREYRYFLENLKNPPALVVSDSQTCLKMVADTPVNIPCTTFSILFSRYKGDLHEMVKGLRVIDELKSGDKVLIAEACSHHAIEDDIGRVKIPRWLRQFTGADIQVNVTSGRDYPDNLKDYRLIIHCGACMLTRREMLVRIQKAQEAEVAITNYGLAIAYLQGVLRRVLSPFPLALEYALEYAKFDKRR